MESDFQNNSFKQEAHINNSIESQNNCGPQDVYGQSCAQVPSHNLDKTHHISGPNLEKALHIPIHNSEKFLEIPDHNMEKSLCKSGNYLDSKGSDSSVPSLSSNIITYDLETIGSETEKCIGDKGKYLRLTETVTVLVDSFLNLDNEHRVLFIRFFVSKLTVHDFDLLQKTIELRNTVKTEIVAPIVRDESKLKDTTIDEPQPSENESSQSSPNDKLQTNWPENHPKRFCNVSFEEGDFDINFDEENDGLNVLSALKKIKAECDNEKKDKPYECETCGKSFFQKNNLLIHSRKHTGETPYDCIECGKKFTDSRLLARHLRKHTGDQLYHCDQCSKTFLQLDHMTRHKRVHTGEKPFQCPQCPKKFALPYALKMHLRHHTGELPYLCDQCPKAFAVNNHLKKHKLIHTGERPFKCDECSKTFTQAVHMREHKRTHTGEKPYFCDQCPKSFNESGNLKQHKRTHSADRPFTCDECQKTFSGPSDLKKHKNSHLKPYMCNYCSKTFSRTAYLKSHILSNHSVEGTSSNKPKPNNQQTTHKMEILHRYNESSSDSKLETVQRYSDPTLLKMETLQRYSEPNGARQVVQMSHDNRSSVALVQEILFHPKNHLQTEQVKDQDSHRIEAVERSGILNLPRFHERSSTMSLPQENGVCVPLVQEMIFHQKNPQSEIKPQETLQVTSGARTDPIIPQDMIFPPKKLYS